MRHLTPDEIVDAAERCADAGLAAHARDCMACRSKIEAVTDALRLARCDRLAEPSPLFWPHLAARIGEAVRRERVRTPFWRVWGWTLAPIGAVAVLAIVVTVEMRMQPGAPVSDPAARIVETPAPAFELRAADGDPADDPSWVLVSTLSADVSVEDTEASGALPPPGGADKALFHLDDAERLELARLLREELESRVPAVPQGPGA
jgi:hypothetical protein